MESNNDLRDELNKMAPGFPEKQFPTPPEGYFPQFPEKVMARWKQEIADRKPLHLWRRIAGIAAIIAALVVTGLWVISNEKTTNTDQITALEAYQYIHENIDEFEDMIPIESLPQEVHQLDVPKEEIEEYLLQELSDEEAEELF